MPFWPFSRSYLSYGDSSVNLLSSERSISIQALPAVAAMSVFKGSLPRHELRKQAIKVIQANPWLTSRNVRTPLGPDMRYYRHVSPDACSEYIVEHHLETLDAESSPEAYEHALKELDPFITGKGTSTLDQLDEPQFRLVLLEDNFGRCGIFMSLSHVLADGFTFYSVFNQFAPGADVVALEAERSEVALKRCQKQLSIHYILGWNGVITTFFNAVTTIVRNIIRPQSKCVLRFYEVDHSAVEKTKKEIMKGVRADSSSSRSNSASAASTGSSAPTSSSSTVSKNDVPYISTNDLICSRFAAVAQQPVNLMVVNCRNRIDGVTESMAGNYDSLLIYRPSDCDSPIKIRRSVQILRADANPLPDSGALYHGMTVMSNWATFYREMKLPDCEMQFHIPVSRPITILSGAYCIVFMKKEGQVAIMAMLPVEKHAQWKKHAAGIFKI